MWRERSETIIQFPRECRHGTCLTWRCQSGCSSFAPQMWCVWNITSNPDPLSILSGFISMWDHLGISKRWFGTLKGMGSAGFLGSPWITIGFFLIWPHATGWLVGSHARFFCCLPPGGRCWTYCYPWSGTCWVHPRLRRSACRDRRDLQAGVRWEPTCPKYIQPPRRGLMMRFKIDNSNLRRSFSETFGFLISWFIKSQNRPVTFGVWLSLKWTAPHFSEVLPGQALKPCNRCCNASPTAVGAMTALHPRCMASLAPMKSRNCWRGHVDWTSANKGMIQYDVSIYGICLLYIFIHGWFVHHPIYHLIYHVLPWFIMFLSICLSIYLPGYIPT